MLRMDHFEFDFDPRYKGLLLLMGASPRTAHVAFTDGGALVARFGFVRLETPLSNVAGYEVTGGYRWWRAIGVRTSFSDRGLTFGSNIRRGVCIRFAEPVAASPPLGPIRHPGLTVTLKDIDSFIERLSSRMGPENGTVA
jgi:hypothetical protein